MPVEPLSICIWTEDENGAWHTSCNNIFEVIFGCPSDNNMRFCCYCGKDLTEDLYVEKESHAR